MRLAETFRVISLAECLFGRVFIWPISRQDEYSFGRTVRLAETFRVISLAECLFGRVFIWPISRHDEYSFGRTVRLAEIVRVISLAENTKISAKRGPKVGVWSKVGVWPKISDTSWPKVGGWPKISDSSWPKVGVWPKVHVWPKVSIAYPVRPTDEIADGRKSRLNSGREPCSGVLIVDFWSKWSCNFLDTRSFWIFPGDASLQNRQKL